MDPIKRGAFKLSRFYDEYYHVVNREGGGIWLNGSLSSIPEPYRKVSLRQTIRNHMFSFLLPSPIGDTNAEWTHALLEILYLGEHYGNGKYYAIYRLYARFKPKIAAPMRLAFGFNFYGGGRWNIFLSWLNVPSFKEASIMYTGWHVSHWLGQNFFGAAFDEGVNFRMCTLTDLSINETPFGIDCMRTLDGPKYRQLGRSDGDNEPPEYTQEDAIIANYSLENGNKEVDLSYPIGKIYDEFFS